MSKNGDFLSNLKSIANHIQLGNKNATEVADSLNTWLKESSEALKVKIEDEVERSVSKMGFVKRGEFEALKQEVAALKKDGRKASTAQKPMKKATSKPSVRKSSTKKSVKKVAKKSTAKKVAK